MATAETWWQHEQSTEVAMRKLALRGKFLFRKKKGDLRGIYFLRYIVEIRKNSGYYNYQHTECLFYLYFLFIFL